MNTIRRLGCSLRTCQPRFSFTRYIPTGQKPLGMFRELRFGFCKAKEGIPPDFHKNKVREVETGQGFQSIQLKTACLSLYSYIICSDGEAAIIDPLNETAQYQKILADKNLKLKYILMTHFHADFVSGQTDLTRMYPDVKIVMGKDAKTSAYKVNILNEGDSIQVGHASISAIHTPGHTLESTCYLLTDKSGKPHSLYTGDTVFIGEVGRPDLANSDSNTTSEKLAKMMYASVQKLKSLPDEVIVYPAHGAGSACGKNIGKGDKSTVGSEKSNNYAFKAGSESSFVSQLLKDIQKPPNYFFNSVEKNKESPFDFEQTFHRVFQPLTPETFREQMKQPNTVVLDVRSQNGQYYDGVIKGAYFVGHKGPFATYVGTLFKSTDNFLVFGKNQEEVTEATKRLLRIGYLNIKGYNDFDLDEWQGGIVKYNEGTLGDLKSVGDAKSSYEILDLRNKPELEKDGRYSGNNSHVPIPELEQSIANGSLSKDKRYLVHCASGYRSKIAATLLHENGYDFKVLANSYGNYRDNGATVTTVAKVN